MKLFIANIAFSASEADLRELFEQIGPVTRCRLIMTNGKSRGYAFVEYESDLDAARAIDDLHESHFMGRRLVVQESRNGGQR